LQAEGAGGEDIASLSAGQRVHNANTKSNATASVKDTELVLTNEGEDEDDEKADQDELWAEDKEPPTHEEGEETDYAESTECVCLTSFQLFLLS
jgi:hypothetical protein